MSTLKAPLCLVAAIAIACGVPCSITSIEIALGQPSQSNARSKLSQRNNRVSSRYELGENDVIVGVTLPSQFNNTSLQPSETNFNEAQEIAVTILLDALKASGIPRLGFIPGLANTEIFGYDSTPNIFLLRGNKPQTLERLHKAQGIAFVSTTGKQLKNEPNQGKVLIPDSAAASPTPFHPYQIGFENPGEVPYIDADGRQFTSKKDVDIDILDAWRHTIGSNDVVVAIIDEGFDLTKPELQANLYTNAKEIPCNGIDDDKNGAVDDYQGWNSAVNSGCPAAIDETITGHGTAMALTIAASPRLTKSAITGVAPGIKFLPIQNTKPLKWKAALPATSQTPNAYEYVLNLKRAGVPIRIVNLSFGNDCTMFLFGNKRVGAAFGALINEGITLVAAAGNNGANNDKTSICPANVSSKFDNIISVADVAPNGTLPFYSNFSRTNVTTAAPGTAMYDGYSFKTGTSISTAVVSGIAALMYSANPSLTGSDVKRIILESTKMLDSELPVQSKGMVSAGTAVRKAVELRR